MAFLGVAASLVGAACSAWSLAFALANTLGVGPNLNLKGVSLQDPRLDAYSGMLSINRSTIHAPELPSTCDVRDITPSIDLGEGDVALLLKSGAKSWLIWFDREPDGRLEWVSEVFQAKGPITTTVYSGTFPAEVEIHLRGPLGEDRTPVVTKSFSKGAFLPDEIADLVDPGRQRSPEEIGRIIASWDAKQAAPGASSQP